MNKKEMLVDSKAIIGSRKKTIIIILLLVLVFIVVLALWQSQQSQKNMASLSTVSQSADSQADIIYYFGQECTHCKNVDKFIAENKIADKLSFAKKETWHNIPNGDEMQEKAKECILDPAKVGVPFLWARGKCYVGEVEVQNFLKKEIGMQ